MQTFPTVLLVHAPVFPIPGMISVRSKVIGPDAVVNVAKAGTLTAPDVGGPTKSFSVTDVRPAKLPVLGLWTPVLVKKTPPVFTFTVPEMFASPVTGVAEAKDVKRTEPIATRPSKENLRT